MTDRLRAEAEILPPGPQPSLGVGLVAGTTGLGADVSYALWTDHLNLRAGYHALDYDFKGDYGTASDKTTYIVGIRLQSAPLLLDWFPGGYRFRISAGLVWNRNRFDFSAKPGPSVSVNEQRYRMDDIRGRLTFPRKYGPYLGLGYGNALGRSGRIHFGFDGGLLFHGRPDVQLEATASEPLLQPFLDRDVAAERRKINQTARRFQVYPVLRFGLSAWF